MSSQALSKAKSRRAGLQSTTPPTSTVNQIVEPPKQKMSIPMYLNILDKRINSLDEKISNSTNLNSIQLEVESEEGKKTMNITEYMTDMDTKFAMLVEEIANFKETISKLQTFTMDVTKDMHNKLSEKEKKEKKEEKKEEKK